MQKLIRRADLAKRQAVRRKTAQNGKIASDTLKNHRNERDEINRSIIRDIRHERTARREDWQMGPLAPKRDVGRATKTYGALTSQRTQGIDNPNWKDYHIVENDRVVIVTKGHRDQGKIGRVTEVRKEKEECIIEDLNKALITIPEHMLENEPDKTPFRPYSLPVPLSEVRLVARLPHPETGIERDVVINELAKGSIRDPKPYYDKSRDKSTKGRYIAGLVPRTFIPWPKKATEEWDDNDSDTLRLDVEEATFTPTLHEPPMPMSIIDELRNKYSKFRTRHDDEYVEKVKAQDRTKRENKEMLKLKMVTPMQELKLKEKALKDAEGTPQLSKELLASIGQVMAKNGQRAVPPKAGM